MTSSHKIINGFWGLGMSTPGGGGAALFSQAHPPASSARPGLQGPSSESSNLVVVVNISESQQTVIKRKVSQISGFLSGKGMRIVTSLALSPGLERVCTAENSDVCKTSAIW